MLDILNSAILGIIQGITEWLPISSTGHLILAQNFFPLSFGESFLEAFNVVIQFGSILAVLVLYFNKLNPFSKKKTKDEQLDTFKLWLLVIIAIIPAGIIGALFDDQIDALFFNPTTVAITLILYGVVFLFIEKRKKRIKYETVSEISKKTALIIGIFQVLALIPGTSRSGSTIIGGILAGASRSAAAEFSFFLAIPIMFGASLLKLLKIGFSFSIPELTALLTGTAVSFIVSVFAIKFLIGYIKKNDFKAFGWYRIILGIIVFIYFQIM